MPDKALADLDPLQLPAGTVLKQDLGFVGHAPATAAKTKALNEAIARTRQGRVGEVGVKAADGGSGGWRVTWRALPSFLC